MAQPLTEAGIKEAIQSGNIFKAYYKAQQQLDKIIFEVEQVGVPTTATQAARLQTLQEQTDNIVKRLDKLGKKTILKGTTDAWKMVKMDSADMVLKGLPAGVDFKASFSKIDQKKVLIAAQSIQDALHEALVSTEKKVSNIIRRTAVLGGADYKATEALQGGAILGSSKSEMNKVVQGIIKEEVGTTGGTVAVRGKDGIVRNYQLSKYADMVVNARMREIATAATKQTMLDAQEELGVRPLIEISRHADESDICLSWIANSVDNRFSAVPGDPEYPYIETAGGGGPPWQPNCRHVATPYVELPE